MVVLFMAGWWLLAHVTKGIEEMLVDVPLDNTIRRW
jgi:hypothetical protein